MSKLNASVKRCEQQYHFSSIEFKLKSGIIHMQIDLYTTMIYMKTYRKRGLFLFIFSSYFLCKTPTPSPALSEHDYCNPSNASFQSQNAIWTHANWAIRCFSTRSTIGNMFIWPCSNHLNGNNMHSHY